MSNNDDQQAAERALAAALFPANDRKVYLDPDDGSFHLNATGEGRAASQSQPGEDRGIRRQKPHDADPGPNRDQRNARDMFTHTEGVSRKRLTFGEDGRTKVEWS